MLGVNVGCENSHSRTTVNSPNHHAHLYTIAPESRDMRSYTIWGESGGIGKTTFAYNIGAAHQRAGYDVLLIDMDTQNGGLTKHAGLLGTKSNPDVEKFVWHLTDHHSQGDIEDTIYTHPHDGFDIIPSHDKLGKFQDFIEGKRNYDETWPKDDKELLQQTIIEENLDERYDILIVDPPAKTSLELENALYATRNIVAPVEVSPKGQASVSGLKAERDVVENDLDIEIGVLGMIPNQVAKNVNINQSSMEEITEDMDIGVAPVSFKIRRALIDGAWNAEKSVFSFAEQDKDRVRSHEKTTLKKFMYLAGLLTEDYSSEDDPTELPLPIDRGTSSRPQPRDENGKFVSPEEVEEQTEADAQEQANDQARADD